MKLPTHLPKILRSFVLLLGAAPALAAPPASVNVVIEDTKPLVNDDFIYMKIQGDTQYDALRGRLAIDVYLKNNENFAVTIDNVALDWDQPNNVATTLEDSGMEMWCQGNANVMTGTNNLVMPANTRCQLGLTPDPLIGLPAPGKLRLLVRFVGITASATTPQRDLVAYANSTAAGSYRFPHQREDLEPGEFWSGRSGISGTHHRFGDGYGDDNGMYAYDLGVARWDGTTWVNYEVPVAGETGSARWNTNDDFMAWEKPVYAMADGIVQDCDGGNPDNPAGQEGGNWNFFKIDHGEETVFYGHLRQNEVNEDFCYEGAVVHEGDFLGLVGSSGLSGGVPHLHVQVMRGGDPMPLLFHDCFSVERVANFGDAAPNGNAPWTAHRGYGLSTTPIVIWPSGLRRRGQAVGSAATEVAIASISTSYTVTAIRTGGNLALSLWDTHNDGEAQLLDTETGGAVSKVALAVPTGTSDAGLAMITAAGNLKISAVNATTTTLDRTANYDSIAVKAVAASSAPFTYGMTTAVVNSADVLKVTAWAVDPAGASITKLDEATGPTSEDVKVVRTIGFRGWRWRSATAPTTCDS